MSRKGKLLVIGILAQEGEEHKELAQAGAWVEKQVGHRMLQSGEEVAGEYQFNPMKVLPNDLKHFYAYGGSLTTPPCTVSGCPFAGLQELQKNRGKFWRSIQDF